MKKPVRQGSFGRLWQSMRSMRVFSLADLIVTAFVPMQTAMTFLYKLQKAGFVRREPYRNASRKAVYRLIRNTGPNFPRIERDGSVRDRNGRGTR